MPQRISINTKYAKRDIQRMSRAIDELTKVKGQYNNIISTLSSAYKGDASVYLQNQIATVKVKNIDQIISSLNTAKVQLSITVKKADAANAELKKIIKG